MIDDLDMFEQLLELIYKLRPDNKNSFDLLTLDKDISDATELIFNLRNLATERAVDDALANASMNLYTMSVNPKKGSAYGVAHTSALNKIRVARIMWETQPAESEFSQLLSR